MIEFDPVRHEYFLDDRQLSSLSEVRRAAGLDEFFNIDQQYRDRGNAVHYATTLIDQGEYDPDTTHPEVHRFASGYLAFKREHRFEIEGSEEIVWCPSMGVAGRLDRRIVMTGERIILDFKSGSLPALVGIQLNGYKYLLASSHSIKADKVRCLLLPGDGSYRLVSHVTLGGKSVSLDDPMWLQAFFAATKLYGLRKQAGLIGNGAR